MSKTFLPTQLGSIIAMNKYNYLGIGLIAIGAIGIGSLGWNLQVSSADLTDAEVYQELSGMSRHDRISLALSRV